jgi:hypothetical protein
MLLLLTPNEILKLNAAAADAECPLTLQCGTPSQFCEF